MVGARATPLWAMIRLYIAHQKGEDGILVSAAKASLQWTTYFFLVRSFIIPFTPVNYSCLLSVLC